MSKRCVFSPITDTLKMNALLISWCLLAIGGTLSLIGFFLPWLRVYSMPTEIGGSTILAHGTGIARAAPLCLLNNGAISILVTLLFFILLLAHTSASYRVRLIRIGAAIQCLAALLGLCSLLLLAIKVASDPVLAFRITLGVIPVGLLFSLGGAGLALIVSR